MRKKIFLALFLICAATLCCAIVACASDNEIENLKSEGYVVTVTFDSNGGEFNGSSFVVYMFNPTDYEVDETGAVRIKLTEPTVTRKDESGTNTSIELRKDNYFFCGWYQTRIPETDADGNILDADGNILTESVLDEEGVYYIEGTDEESTPNYIAYADMWDFDNDYIVYTGEDIDITLYAAWVPYFEFEYFYEDDGEWVQYATTRFDYKTQQAEGTDINTIWEPAYPDEGGAMNYAYRYVTAGGTYNFPSRSGYTYSSAYYYDADGIRQNLDGSLVHFGYIDYSTGTAVNGVIKIYVEFVEGERYKIYNASQFSSNGNVAGWYEIFDDLDFTGVNWPISIMTGTFAGKIYSSESGVVRKFENVYAEFTSSSASYGGLFGCIGAEAQISDVTFDNVTFDIASAGRNVSYASFGLFAGDMYDEAEIVNVTLSGELNFRIGAIGLGSGNSFNLLSNGDIGKINVTSTEVNLIFYGDEGTGLMAGSIGYSVNFDSIEIDEGTYAFAFNINSSISYSDEYEEEYRYVITINQ